VVKTVCDTVKTVIYNSQANSTADQDDNRIVNLFVDEQFPETLIRLAQDDGVNVKPALLALSAVTTCCPSEQLADLVRGTSLVTMLAERLKSPVGYFVAITGMLADIAGCPNVGSVHVGHLVDAEVFGPLSAMFKSHNLARDNIFFCFCYALEVASTRQVLAILDAGVVSVLCTSSVRIVKDISCMRLLARAVANALSQCEGEETCEALWTSVERQNGWPFFRQLDTHKDLVVRETARGVDWEVWDEMSLRGGC
jgi:hypothetical protein